MARIFLGNFDFEHQIATSGYNRPAHLLPLTKPDDRVHFDEPLPHEFLAAAADAGLVHGRSVTNSPPAVSLQAAPWGWSETALRAASQLGCHVTAPPLDVVRRANSRTFSHELEIEIGKSLSGARRILAVDDLNDAIRRGARKWETPVSDFQWIVKAEFGMAGRERLTGRGDQLDKASINWLTSRLKQQHAAYFEPQVQPEIELSTQWDLPMGRAESPTFLGMTEILPGCPGNGIRADDAFPEVSSETLQSIVATGRRIADQLHGDGYFGPLGIDAMVYTSTDGQAVVRPTQDINARWTMGRVALELYRRLNLTGDARWLHVPTEQICQRLGLETKRERQEFHRNHTLDVSDQMRRPHEQSGQQPLPSWTDQSDAWARCLLTSPLWLADRAPKRTGILYTTVPQSDRGRFPDARVERT